MSDDGVRIPRGLTTDGLLGKRYLARFLDSVLILLVLAIPAVIVIGLLLPKNPAMHTPLMMLPVILVVWIGYGTLLEASTWQATVGKKLFGLRVYNGEGARLTLLQSAGRNSIKDGPFLLLGVMPGGQLIALGLLCVHLFVIHRSQVNQAVHDRAMQTLVAGREETTQLHLA